MANVVAKGATGVAVAAGGDAASGDCTESIEAFALLQYRQLDGPGWSRPLTTKVPPTPPHPTPPPIRARAQPRSDSAGRAARRMYVCE